MRIRQIALVLAFALALLSLAACHWTPVIMDGHIRPSALHPQTAPVPSQLHTLLAARGRG